MRWIKEKLENAIFLWHEKRYFAMLSKAAGRPISPDEFWDMVANATV